jgi:hypothetical protein
MLMSDEDAARARLLAYYEQKGREMLERAEEVRSMLPGIEDRAKRTRLAIELTFYRDLCSARLCWSDCKLFSAPRNIKTYASGEGRGQAARA